MRRYLTILLLFFVVVLAKGEGRDIKIISLSPAITEMIFALEKGDLLIGRSSACNYPEKVLDIPIVGDFARPELEKILRLKPNYIFSNDLENPAMKKIFYSANINTKIMQCRNIDDYKKWLKYLGKVLNAEKKADELIAMSIKEETKLKSMLSPENEQVKAIWIIWDSPLLIAGKNSLPDTIMKLANINNCAKNINNEYVKASFEWLKEQDPEYLIWLDLSENKFKQLKSHPIWSSLKAVKNSKIIYKINSDKLLRPSPRIFDGINELKNSQL